MRDCILQAIDGQVAKGLEHDPCNEAKVLGVWLGECREVVCCCDVFICTFRLLLLLSHLVTCARCVPWYLSIIFFSLSHLFIVRVCCCVVALQVDKMFINHPQQMTRAYSTHADEVREIALSVSAERLIFHLYTVRQRTVAAMAQG